MNRKTALWIAIALCGVAIAIAVALAVRRESGESAADQVITEFHTVERASLQAFNDALHRQRANDIDELGLAEQIDRDVLPPWRTMRAHVEAIAEIPERRRALFVALRRYLANRQTAWEAYSAALRSPSDVAARPHYDVYHQKNSDAQDDARVLGPMLRDL